MYKRIKPSLKILMTKKIADSLTEDEQLKLDSFMKGNYLAQKYYSELVRVWEMIGITFRVKNQVNLEFEWMKFCKRIDELE